MDLELEILAVGVFPLVVSADRKGGSCRVCARLYIYILRESERDIEMSCSLT